MKDQNENPFGNVIDVYSRAQAIADGFQTEANPKTRKEAGIKFPVFLTRSVYERYVQVPKDFDDWGQSEDGRLWDLFTMFRHYAQSAEGSFIEFKVIVCMPDRGDWSPNERWERSMNEPGDMQKTHRRVTLHAVIGPLDFDDPRPAITIMIPGED